MIPDKITVRVTSSGQAVEVKVLNYRAEGIEVVLGEGVHSVRCQLSPTRNALAYAGNAMGQIAAVDIAYASGGRAAGGPFFHEKPVVMARECGPSR